MARAEDLAVLLDGVAEIALARPPLAGPADLLLEVTVDRVRLAGVGVDVAAGMAGYGRGWPRR